MAESTSFTVKDVEAFKRKAIAWANQFPVFCCLESNSYPYDLYHAFDFVLGIDALESLESRDLKAFDSLKKELDASKNWFLGYLGYDLKNEVEKLASNNEDILGLPDSYFFRPRYLITILNNSVQFNRSYLEASGLMDQIESMQWEEGIFTPIQFENKTSKSEYMKTVHKIRDHIIEGDIYEMNYCTNFYAQNVTIEPIDLFERLNAKSKAPFASLFKKDGFYSIGASPERFLQKRQNKLVSQPIKGTIRKSDDTIENEALKKELANDTKEQAENVMIVDLVRNDLTKSAVTGSIKVDELFGIYEFATINQMISTVSAELRKDVHPVDAIKNAFPMGSMTGAPKVKAMELIERYEAFKRSLYSGAIGYFTPTQDFDFNVVIRTINYDSNSNYLSVPVGGAITYDSVPEKEYAEMLTKIEAIVEILKAEN